MSSRICEKLNEAISGKFAKLKRIVLATLLQEGRPLTMKELAEKSGKGYSYIVTVVSELVNAGILKKEEDPEDRRRVLVWFRDGIPIEEVKKCLAKVLEQIERERKKAEEKALPPELQKLYEETINFVMNNVAGLEIVIDLYSDTGGRQRKVIPLTLNEIKMFVEKVFEIPRLREKFLRELGLIQEKKEETEKKSEAKPVVVKEQQK